MKNVMEYILNIVVMVILKKSVIIKMTKEKENILNIIKVVKIV